MPKKIDLLKQKLDMIFANRQKQIEFFRELITSTEVECSLLTLRGIGGIGKTMLLGAFQRKCGEYEVPVALVDVGVQRSITEVLRSIRDQLTQTSLDITLKSFDEAVVRYLSLDAQLRKSGIISTGTLDFVSRAPTLSPARSVLSMAPGGLEGEGSELVINKIYQCLEKADADYFLAPEVLLTEKLLESVNEYAKTRHLCIMFDRYEVVPVLLDRWIRRDLFSNLEKFAILVISGRALLPPEWGKWSPLIKDVELSPFPKSEVQELLELFGITSAYLVEQIAEFSGGVPLAVSLAAQLVRDRGTEDFSVVSDKYDVIEELVEVLIRDASPELENMLEICAVLRWFNEESIEALAGRVIPEVYRLVRGYDFIRQGRYGFEMHDRVRDFINQDLKRRAPIRYRQLNQLAGEYYNKLFEDKLLQDSHLLLLEKLYHRLHADERAGMAELRKVYNEAALLIQPAFCQALIEVAESAHLEDEMNQLWIKYFKGSLARQRSDFAEAERIFRQLSQNPLTEREPELKAELYYYWGVALWYVCEFTESLTITQKAVTLNNNLGKTHFENRSLGVVGLALDRMGNFREALDTVAQMVTQARKTGDRVSEAYGLNSTGYFSWHSGAWDRAEEALIQQQRIWIDLGSKFGECYSLGHLGLLYTAIDDFKSGASLLTTGLVLSRESGNKEMECKILQNFSEFERRNKKYRSAAKYAREAYDLSCRLQHKYYQSDSLRLWGQALGAMKNFAAAAQKYGKSLALAETLQATYMVMRNKVALFHLAAQGHSECSDERKDLTTLLELKGYYHLLSDVYLAEADCALRTSQTEFALQCLGKACTSALKYNWHWFDRVLLSVRDQCVQLNRSEHSEFAIGIYDFLIQFCQTESVNGTPFVEMENKAPRVRRGRGMITLTVMDRLATERSKLR